MLLREQEICFNFGMEIEKPWTAPHFAKNKATIGNTSLKNKNWKGHFINEICWLPVKNYLLRNGPSTSPEKVKKKPAYIALVGETK